MEQTQMGESGETDTKSRHRAHSQHQEERVLKNEKQLKHQLINWCLSEERKEGVKQKKRIKYQLSVQKNKPLG